jgi:hypothetical protein
MVTSLKRADWIQLLASAGLLFNAVSGLITGSASFFHGRVRRTEDPTPFWIAVAMSAGMGVSLILMTLL